MRADRIDAVLLDMGGVLIPELQTYERSVRDRAFLEALAAQGVANAESFVVERAKRLREAYRALQDECRQPCLDDVLADCTPVVRALLLGAFKREAAPAPYAHARAVVAELAYDFALGIVSNNAMPGDHHARVLQRAGILQHVGCAVWSANFGRRKPDPAMIFHVLDRLGVPCERAIFVGDSTHDMHAGNAAGVATAAALWGPFSRAQLQTAKPDHWLGDITELRAVVERLAMK